jgi:CDP-diacylglycerol---serine O-phosphatidyltransferase
MRQLPNFITSLNLASGFISILFIFQGDIITASWLIVAAMIFDFLDGFAARALKAYSEIGKELDSLADAVSFGVAPGLMIYYLLNSAFMNDSQTALRFSGFNSLFVFAVPAIMPVCAALRLAKFNIDTTQSKSFKGLPTPANALAVISLIIGSHYSGSQILSSFLNSPVALVILSLILSILMVTRIPLFSFKFSNYHFKGNGERYIMIFICVVLTVIFGSVALPLIIPVYLIISVISILFTGKVN